MSEQLTDNKIKAEYILEPLRFNKRGASLRTEEERRLQRQNVQMLTKWGTNKSKYEGAFVFVAKSEYI